MKMQGVDQKDAMLLPVNLANVRIFSAVQDGDEFWIQNYC